MIKCGYIILLSCVLVAATSTSSSMAQHENGNSYLRKPKSAVPGDEQNRQGIDNIVERPVMHTFFTSLETMTAGMTDSGHALLLNEWKNAWHAAGWDTIILTLDDAKRHPDFDKYNEFLTQHSPNEYDKLCFLRWFAMAAAGGGWMADYDAFPLEISAKDCMELPNEGKFTGHNSFVPSLVSGSAEEWNRMAHELVHAIQDPGFTYFESDMFALKYLQETRPESYIFEPVQSDVFGGVFYSGPGIVDCDALKGKKAMHFSHYSIQETAEQGRISGIAPDKSEEAVQLRWKIASTLMNQWSDQCFRANGEQDSINLYLTDKTQTISRENKLIYVHTPTTGGASLERSELFDDARKEHEIGGHYTIDQLMENSEDRGLSGFLRTSHIRHPCSRFVSAFNYLTSDVCNQGDQEWAKANIGNLSIDEFVARVGQDPGALQYMHFRPLHHWLFSGDGSFGLDTVLCQETWDMSLDRLGNQLERPIPDTLYSRHSLKNDHESCSDLAPETRKTIERLYQKDYCIFQYDSLPSQTCPGDFMSQAEFTERFELCSADAVSL